MKPNNLPQPVPPNFFLALSHTWRVLLVLVCMALFRHASAAETALESRALTADEIKSFHQFYQKLHPKDKPVSPIFSATHNGSGKDKKWLVAATISSTSGHGFKNLCHGQEDNYVYGKSGAKSAEWRVGYQRIQQVWVDKSRDCGAPAHRFELSVPLPDADVLEVLENANAIFDRYGAFIKGFSCRRMSTAALSLTAIGTGADNNGEIMYKLSYRNEADDAGDLLLRKVGHDFTPWDFRCSAP